MIENAKSGHPGIALGAAPILYALYSKHINVVPSDDKNILRDIISMGAMPIALLDSLRFGPLDDEKSRYLFEHVVKGISDYGNRVGVPTVAGEIEFDESFRTFLNHKYK